MTAGGPAGESRDRVISRLVASVQELDTAGAQRALAAARADRGRALREVDALLTEHPGALVTTPAAYPLALVRLAHALMEAGYQAIAAPACAGCGKITAGLRRKIVSGRVCGTCAARGSTETCARCGRARRINARRPEGGICSACYDKDEQVVTECGGCGRTRRTAARMPDGTARCQFCATRPARTCSVCGQQRTVAGSTDAGPVCASCYQAPQRPCGRCGRTRKIARRATASDPDLCYGCYQGAVAVCSACGQTRPCQRISSGSPICRSCRARPPRPCFRCGRDRPVQAEWPAGPVCVGCYEHVRRHPAECAGCGVVRPLIGSNESGRLLCGPCAGAPGLDYTCRECGGGGQIHSSRRCFRCVLAERARILLAGPGGDVSVQLHPLLEALTAVTNPATVVKWLGTSQSARLLGRLARTGNPITHDMLDDLPQPRPCTTSGKYWSARVSCPPATSTWSAWHLGWSTCWPASQPTTPGSSGPSPTGSCCVALAGPPPGGPSPGDQLISPGPASWPPWTCCPGWTIAARPCATLLSRIWTSGSPEAPPPAGPCATSSSGHMAAAWPAI